MEASAHTPISANQSSSSSSSISSSSVANKFLKFCQKALQIQRHIQQAKSDQKKLEKEASELKRQSEEEFAESKRINTQINQVNQEANHSLGADDDSVAAGTKVLPPNTVLSEIEKDPDSQLYHLFLQCQHLDESVERYADKACEHRQKGEKLKQQHIAKKKESRKLKKEIACKEQKFNKAMAHKKEQIQRLSQLSKKRRSYQAFGSSMSSDNTNSNRHNKKAKGVWGNALKHEINDSDDYASDVNYANDGSDGSETRSVSHQPMNVEKSSSEMSPSPGHNLDAKVKHELFPAYSVSSSTGSSPSVSSSSSPLAPSSVNTKKRAYRCQNCAQDGHRSDYCKNPCKECATCHTHKEWQKCESYRKKQKSR